jgi:hypothetical protein
MSIDTSEKRLSLLDFDPTTSVGIPLPWATLGDPEKLHFLWLYAGIFDEPVADVLWPFDDLKPRDIGIYPCFGNIGGGVSLTGKEPVTTSTGGYWRFVLGGIPVKTRANIKAWRAIEAQLEGRGKTVAIPIYDGKRAPWPASPGGTIDAESFGDVAEGDTALQIVPTNIADLEPGMGFSVDGRYYRIVTVQGESSVFDVTIFPPVRDAWPTGQALEFRRPICRVRLADTLGMSLDLDGHKRADATVEFVEAN